LSAAPGRFIVMRRTWRRLVDDDDGVFLDVVEEIASSPFDHSSYVSGGNTFTSPGIIREVIANEPSRDS
jgi:hypothetical protein